MIMATQWLAPEVSAKLHEELSHDLAWVQEFWDKESLTLR